jgi:hypothetical protein
MPLAHHWTLGPLAVRAETLYSVSAANPGPAFWPETLSKVLLGYGSRSDHQNGSAVFYFWRALHGACSLSGDLGWVK